MRPLILTLALDEASFERLDALRRAHFLPERNHLAAHLTLFHALPGEEEAAVLAALGRAAAETPPLALLFPGLRSLGRGVAYVVDSPPLLALRARLARDLAPWLGAQDRQGWRPHVTVQNKVEAGVARALLDRLSAGHAPWEGRGEGLLPWRYLGGPWEGLGRFPFGAESVFGK